MKFFWFLIVFFFWEMTIIAEGVNEKKSKSDSPDSVLVVFYNMENLFDCQDDPGKGDDDFLPWRGRYWTPQKLQNKINHLSKAIISAGEPPVIIGLSEVENLRIVKKLVFGGPLRGIHYSYLHHDSPDHRGIDVAFLYRSEYFRVLKHCFIPIKKGKTTYATREILYVRGILGNRDTLDLFVNHWPSLYGGRKPSASLRSCVVNCLCQVLDTLSNREKCIVMGDLNVEPKDSILAQLSSLPNNSLKFLPFVDVGEKKVKGTTRFRDQWRVIDQFWISDNWKSRHSKGYFPDRAFIVSSSFLLEEDPNWPGCKPKRSYVGFRYNGGFSDHLPIALRLVWHSFGE